MRLIKKVYANTDEIKSYSLIATIPEDLETLAELEKFHNMSKKSLISVANTQHNSNGELSEIEYFVRDSNYVKDAIDVSIRSIIDRHL